MDIKDNNKVLDCNNKEKDELKICKDKYSSKTAFYRKGKNINNNTNLTNNTNNTIKIKKSKLSKEISISKNNENKIRRTVSIKDSEVRKRLNFFRHSVPTLCLGQGNTCNNSIDAGNKPLIEYISKDFKGKNEDNKNNNKNKESKKVNKQKEYNENFSQQAQREYRTYSLNAIAAIVHDNVNKTSEARNNKVLKKINKKLKVPKDAESDDSFDSFINSKSNNKNNIDSSFSYESESNNNKSHNKSHKSYKSNMSHKSNRNTNLIKVENNTTTQITYNKICYNSSDSFFLESKKEKPKKEKKLIDYICLGLLGKGSFGEVYTVMDKESGGKYAMKIIWKRQIFKSNLLRYIITERNILSKTSHPFIVTLYRAFQTKSKLILILELCGNGDLAKLLLIEKKLSEETAKFYICEILLAIGYLHEKNIVYRDLKPGNVLLDSKGHIKLTDFGLSKEGISDMSVTQTFCGSNLYLAPEMLLKKGHKKVLDWYQLGLNFFELLTGKIPYWGNGCIGDEILRKKIDELEIFRGKNELKDLILGLLREDPLVRLGNLNDVEDIKNHPYFSSVNWTDIYNKSIPPPKVPNEISVCLPKFREKVEFLNEGNGDKRLFVGGWNYVKGEEEEEEEQDEEEEEVEIL